MNREQIINQLAHDPEYHTICRQVARTDADDLYQELMLFILEIPEDKLARLNETCLKCFFFRMAQKQYNSKTSAYHRKFRQPGVVHLPENAGDYLPDIPDDADASDLIADVQEAMAGMYWYDSKLLELYADAGTMRAIASDTGIPLNSVHHTIAGARKQIKKKLAHANK
ncbi:sigma-70 family RNA polymerase sigma factor [Chitinophaga sp. HK235]|uniref:sigma-70 family RNA polymerase sigma factor n=1 Tax=Chitinophaga sp. HK235 TaxID=2952571 RepID=UPI001BA883DE|nr:sigma-70 family RNA polymerase sigma factor [Chitinophaga sp. HK235]